MGANVVEVFKILTFGPITIWKKKGYLRADEFEAVGVLKI